MMKSFSRLRQSKGASLIETAFLSLFFTTFVIMGTSASLSIFDTAREGRAAGLASDMVRQLFKENPNPPHEDIAVILDTLKGTHYFRPDEDHRMIVTVYENHYTLGHVRTGYSAHGPNTASDSRISAYGDGSATPGVGVMNHIYRLEPNELLYAVEIFTGKRGKRSVESESLPYYEFAVILTKT
jgi:hypothetical protein|tara:strand:- start:781 stop:1332 length:552 start_codon:yes stop_codon:yes gene_type:complete